MEETDSYHPETLEEKTPWLVAGIIAEFQQLYYSYATYGWFIVVGAIISLYLWSWVSPHYQKWKKQREEEEYAAKLHKNPDLFKARQEAIIAARQRMQEEHNRMAKIKAERAKELEEQKREEWIARQSGSAGRRLGGAESSESKPGPSKKKDSNFRPEYNPLMGSGSSGGYRPPKRGCPGGGCGR